jgi:hypothetical protein
VNGDNIYISKCGMETAMKRVAIKWVAIMSKRQHVKLWNTFLPHIKQLWCHKWHVWPYMKADMEIAMHYWSSVVYNWFLVPTETLSKLNNIGLCDIWTDNLYWHIDSRINVGLNLRLEHIQRLCCIRKISFLCSYSHFQILTKNSALSGFRTLYAYSWVK